MRWPVNDKHLNTFRTLELLFPISKKEFVLVLFQFKKMIVLNFLLRSKIHHSWFFLICKMYRCLYPEWPHRQCVGLAFWSRRFAADSLQQVLWFAARIAVCNTLSSGGTACVGWGVRPVNWIYRLWRHCP